MRFEKLETHSLKDLFIKQMEELILSRRLNVGDRLPTERELAAQMQVSRAVINGGMAELARKGFIEIVPRKGVFVADYKHQGSIATLTSILEFGGDRFDPLTLDSILDVRLTVETRIAELVCLNAKGEDIKALSRQADKIDEEHDPVVLGRETFLFFHQLSIISGNSIYPLLVYMFKPVYVHWFEAYFRIGHKDRRMAQIRRLIEALGGRDVDAAVAQIKEIIVQGRDLLGRHYVPGQKYDAGQERDAEQD